MEQDILQTLEFHDIQEKLAEKAVSQLAKKRAREWEPSYEPFVVGEWLDETEDAWMCLTEESELPLGETHDIQGLAEKAKKDIPLLPTEFLDLAATLETYEKIRHYFSGTRHLRYPRLEEKAMLLVGQEKLISEIRHIFDDHGELNNHASPALARIRRTKSGIKTRIRQVFQRIIDDKDESTFLRESIITQRNGRFVVPVKEEYRYKFNGIIHDRSSTGQTLFMEPMISVELNNDLADLEAKEKEEILEIFCRLTQNVKQHADELKQNCQVVTDLEFIYARGMLAVEMKGVRARLSTEGVMDLKSAVHPLLQRDTSVPVSLSLGKYFHILIISGSNAGGKTIAMKTAGILALMNQAGLFIPAEEGSVLPIYKNIHAVIGDDQSIFYNLSTFSGYITQLQAVLEKVSQHDLVLLDELGTGTDPIEGAALAQAVTEYLQSQGVSCIITSHFDEMKKLAYENKGIENAFVEFNEETLMPTYRLVLGAAGNSHAIRICRRLQMSEMVLKRAEILSNSSPLHHMKEVMSELNGRLQELEKEKAEISAIYEEAKRLQRDLKNESEAFKERRKTILEKARMEADTIKRDMRNQAERIIKDLKKEQRKGGTGNVHGYVAGMRKRMDALSVPDEVETHEPLRKEDLVKGMTVYITSLGTNGLVQSYSGNTVMVECDGMTVTVPLEKCRKAKVDRQTPKKKERTVSLRYDKPVVSISTSLNIIGKRVEEALPEIDSFLNDALLSGVKSVQIIHGKGTGKLRHGVHSYLKTLSFIKEFHEADIQNGGAGATDVFL